MDEKTNDAPEFTDEQLRAVLKIVGEEARNAAFAAGRSVMIVKEGQLVLLHPDGRQEVVGPVRSPAGVGAKQ